MRIFFRFFRFLHFFRRNIKKVNKPYFSKKVMQWQKMNKLKDKLPEKNVIA